MNATWKPSSSALAGSAALGAAAEVGEHAGRLVGRERRQHREAERAADLLRGVEQAGREPGVLVADVRRRDQRDRHEEQAHADRLRDDRRAARR